MKNYTNTSKLILSFSLIVFASLTCASLYPEKFGPLVGAYRRPTYQNPEKIAADQATADTETNPFIHPLAEETIPLPLVDLHVKNHFLLQHFFTFNPGNTGALNFIPQATWDSTKLLQGENNVFDTIDRTITPFGAAELTKCLVTTKTINALTRQQNVINFLHKRKEAADELINALHGIKKYEHAYFNFLQPNQDVERVINQFFYYNQGSWGDFLGLSSLNSSPIAQNLFHLGGRLRTAGYVGAAAGTAYFAANKVVNTLNDPIGSLLNSDNSKLGLAILSGYLATPKTELSKEEFLKAAKASREKYEKIRPNLSIQEREAAEAEISYLNKYSETGAVIKGEALVDLNKSILTDRSNIKDRFDRLSTFDKFQAAGAAMQATDDIVEHVGNTVANGYNTIANIPLTIINREKINSNLLTYMHAQLINMGHIARQIQALNTTLKQRPVFAKNLVYGKYIQGLFDKNSSDVSDEMRYLMGQLLTNTFTGQPSWVSNKGRIIATYKLMRDSILEWIPVLEAIGEIDAYVSCAKLYDEYKNTDHKFSFVTYPKDLLLHNGYAHPQIHIEQVWNLINPDTQVTTKTITIGTTPENVAVVKNVDELQATALAIILGSTIGISPAHRIKLTPFTKIETLINALRNENTALQQAGQIVDSAQDKDAHASLQIVCIDGTNRAMVSLTTKVVEEIKPLQNIAVIIAQ